MTLCTRHSGADGALPSWATRNPGACLRHTTWTRRSISPRPESISATAGASIPLTPDGEVVEFRNVAETWEVRRATHSRHEAVARIIGSAVGNQDNCSFLVGRLVPRS
jgi:hypothetical protein